MTSCERIEASLRTDFRESIWKPFTEAISRYDLIQPGDRIAVCISGGKDSMLMAKLMQLYQREAPVPFELAYLIMDPGYREVNRQQVEANARLLGIPYTVFESRIFDVANAQMKNPCYLCARMRRGTLYAKAQALGCNKIALGHHFSDVIETTLIAIFYGAQIQGMPPTVQAKNFPGMSLIRPLYMVHEDSILAWRDANRLTFIQCACRFTENIAASENGVGHSKRQEIKQYIRRLRAIYPDVEQNIFNAIHDVRLDTFAGWKEHGVRHSYLEEFETRTDRAEYD